MLGRRPQMRQQLRQGSKVLAVDLDQLQAGDLANAPP